MGGQIGACRGQPKIFMTVPTPPDVNEKYQPVHLQTEFSSATFSRSLGKENALILVTFTRQKTFTKELKSSEFI